LWKLNKSRGNFLNKYRLRADRSFWHYYSLASGNPELLAKANAEELFEWKPDRSNCPELDAMMHDFVTDVPPKWRALVNNIFVGRVLDGEVNALAWTGLNAGVIELNFQYTVVLGAYRSAFDRHMEGIRALTDGTIDLKAADAQERIDQLTVIMIDEIWAAMNGASEDWRDAAKIVGLKPEFLYVPTFRSEELHLESSQRVVSVSEKFVVGHELAHHLLAHTSGRKDAAGTSAMVMEVLKEAGCVDQFTALSSSQQKECMADVLSFLIIAKALDGSVTHESIYEAIAGSVFALIALAHVNRHWFTRDGESHPGFDDRYTIITSVSRYLSRDMVQRAAGDHPLIFLAQLDGFCATAINRMLHDVIPDDAPLWNLTDIAAKLFGDIDRHSPTVNVKRENLA
jgi:hypothetical protein